MTKLALPLVLLGAVALWPNTSPTVRVAPVVDARADDGLLHPNDLTQRAGTLRGGVLTVAFETRVGSWYPEGRSGPAADSMLGIAEVGKPAQVPAPLLRVHRGTTVRGTLRNTLTRPIIVYGLGARRTAADSLVIAAGAIGSFSFVADIAGTYPWSIKSGEQLPGVKLSSDFSAAGVLVVDPPGYAKPDRIIALIDYFTIDTTSPSGLGRGTMAMNGLAWPHTERLAYTQGDSVRLQVVNLTLLDHPMHLHGFYFRVDGVSANGVDTTYTEQQRRMAVTEILPPGNAMRMAFQVSRPGNWVFHCHYAAHLSPRLSSLDTDKGMEHPEHASKHDSEMPHHMSGLVMALSVTPKGTVAALPEPARTFRLEQRERSRLPSPNGGLAYVLTEQGQTVTGTVLSVPAPPLILERGKRIAVNVVNRSSQHAAVHWHGIELESIADGVPGVSGAGRNVMPMIHANDSLTVRWTPTRAGSFMYHTHANEAAQMAAGLYGPIIVLEPGQTFDAEHDRVLFFGTDSEFVNVIMDTPPRVVLNGTAAPAPMEFKAGQRYRLRLFNLAGDFPTIVKIEQNGAPATWKALAKDGYALPPAQALAKPAVLVFEPGEIYDFEFAPTAAGEFTLSFGVPPGPPGFPPPPPLTKVALQVR